MTKLSKFVMAVFAILFFGLSAQCATISGNMYIVITEEDGQLSLKHGAHTTSVWDDTLLDNRFVTHSSQYGKHTPYYSVNLWNASRTEPGWLGFPYPESDPPDYIYTTVSKGDRTERYQIYGVVYDPRYFPEDEDWFLAEFLENQGWWEFIPSGSPSNW